MNRHIQTFHKEEDEEKRNDEMENDRANESSDESSDEEDVQTQGSEADQLDAHLEKNEVFRQWLDKARHGRSVLLLRRQNPDENIEYWPRPTNKFLSAGPCIV